LAGPSALTVLSCNSERATSSSGPLDPERMSSPGSPTERAAPNANDDPKTGADDPKTRAAIARILAASAPNPVHFVGRRPGKAIDPLLTGRVLVVGDDADLAAVVLRMLRRDLLGSVEVAYASPGRRTPVTDLWDLPRGERAAHLAASGEVDLVPLVRDDVGGLLVGVGYLGPVSGTVYVDEHRVLRGAAHRIRVEPDREKGLAVTVYRRRFAGIGRRPRTTLGRAVQIGTVPTTVVRDGIPYPRPMDRWTFYKHIEPLRLVRGVI
jgi:hypothetical protein